MSEPIDMFKACPEGHLPTARMRKEDLSIQEEQRLGKLAKGHENITMLIANGWVILPDPVNRLLPEYRSACLTDLNTNTDQEPVRVEHKGGGKRKRIHR